MKGQLFHYVIECSIVLLWYQPCDVYYQQRFVFAWQYKQDLLTFVCDLLSVFFHFCVIDSNRCISKITKNMHCLDLITLKYDVMARPYTLICHLQNIAELKCFKMPFRCHLFRNYGMKKYFEIRTSSRACNNLGFNCNKCKQMISLKLLIVILALIRAATMWRLENMITVFQSINNVSPIELHNVEADEL